MCGEESGWFLVKCHVRGDLVLTIPVTTEYDQCTGAVLVNTYFGNDNAQK